MSVTRTALWRRFRFLPLQLLLVVSVIGGLVVVTVFQAGSPANHKRSQDHSWAKTREDELKKYNIKEVDLDYIRTAGYVDHQIQTLQDEAISAMNETQLMVTVHSFLDNVDTLCQRRIRMGALGDGGWEVCDDESIRPVFPCLVYSFGARDEGGAFEHDISRVYGCQVHLFNIYYEGNDYNISEKISVHPFGVGRLTEITPGGKELYTLKDIRTILGHSRKPIDLIKMDTEGAEWPSLSEMLEGKGLDEVKQIFVEFHLSIPPDKDRLRRSLRVLRSLSEAGFRKFYVHKNPRGSFHHPNFIVQRAKNYECHFLNSRFTKKKKEKNAKP